ncbi:MAG: hypothetical protein Greene101415_243 [Parcubacteria group bacterium Greene1014_15]|nr:MAG: hypothetical protein Greene101415_243 [Parcubacteria group bacterium Greene1014_15]
MTPMGRIAVVTARKPRLYEGVVTSSVARVRTGMSHAINHSMSCVFLYPKALLRCVTASYLVFFRLANEQTFEI